MRSKSWNPLRCPNGKAKANEQCFCCGGIASAMTCDVSAGQMMTSAKPLNIFESHRTPTYNFRTTKSRPGFFVSPISVGQKTHGAPAKNVGQIGGCQHPNEAYVMELEKFHLCSVQNMWGKNWIMKPEGHKGKKIERHL